MSKHEILDCIVIGGGPAGLTAGIYLARYRRNAIIYDFPDSRAARIPLSHNYPGFPNGITGKDLLANLRQQLSGYQLPIISELVKSIHKNEAGIFVVKTTNGKNKAKNIILCTGVKDIEPKMGHISDGIKQGLIRHCPICDAFEVIGKKIAVIGSGKSGLQETLFLRDYSENVSLITLGKEDNWSKAEIKKIKKAKINILQLPVQKIELTYNALNIAFSDQTIQNFDCVYSALGCVKNNDLIKELPVNLKDGFILVNKKQETSLKGLFAAGDIVSNLNQICVAASQAAIAATAIHKNLRDANYC